MALGPVTGARSWPTGQQAVVACRTATGTSVDTKFSLSFYSEASMIGRTDRRHGESGTGYPGVSNPSTGVYTATFNEMGADKGHVPSATAEAQFDAVPAGHDGPPRTPCCSSTASSCTRKSDHTD
jgi:hypothetical protein